MLRILKFLFTGDWHLCKWETFDKYKIMGNDSKLPTHVQYHCKCSICGRHKKFN